MISGAENSSCCDDHLIFLLQAIYATLSTGPTFFESKHLDTFSLILIFLDMVETLVSLTDELMRLQISLTFYNRKDGGFFQCI